MNKRARQVLIAMGVALLVFLAGFLPQYVRGNALERRALQSERELALCHVRDLAGLTFVQTSLRNYGVASRHATEFFNAAKDLSARTPSAELRHTLEAALQKRDTLTSQLARGDEAAYSSAQMIYLSLLEGPAATTSQR